MANNKEEAPKLEDRLIKELGRRRSNRPLCIVLPTINGNSEIKLSFIQVLPKFGDLPRESAHKHLAQFNLVCSTLRPQGFSDDNLRLLTFSHTLQGRARDWLFGLPPESIKTWNELEEQFLRKFFPESRAANLRIAISSIRQKQEDNLANYWERFQQLCRKCPNHGFSDYQLLTNFFYRGMSSFDRKIVDAASGGSLMNKTLSEAKQLILDMVSNDQQYEDEDDDSLRHVGRDGGANELNVNEKIDALTSLVRGFAMARTEQACYGSGDGQVRNWNNPFSKSYTSDGINQESFKQYAHTDQRPGPELSEIVKSLAQSQLSFQENTRAALGCLGTQVTQLTTQLNKLHTSRGESLSQHEMNSREYVNSISILSGTTLIEDEFEKEHNDVSGDSMFSNSQLLTPPFISSRNVQNKNDEDEKEVVEDLKLEKAFLSGWPTSAQNPSDSTPILSEQGRLLSSSEQMSKPHLKPIPQHLKNASVGENDSPSIKGLCMEQEEKLVGDLNKHRTNIGWISTNIEWMKLAIFKGMNLASPKIP